MDRLSRPDRAGRGTTALRAPAATRALGVALVGALRPEQRQAGRLALEQHGAGSLAAAAIYHRVPGYVLRAYADLPSVQEALPPLRSAVETATARHLRALGDYRRAAALLAAADVPHLVVKGPVLAEHHHGGPDLRSYKDLDLLVPGQSLRVALAAFQDAGWELADRNWLLLREAVAGELHLLGAFGTPIDLHWQLLFRRTLREQFPFDPAEMFAAQRSVSAGISSVPTLDAVDTLLHLCLHAALAGANRLVWLKDVERAIAVDRPDWDEVLRRAHRRGVGPAACLVLARARRSLQADVPKEVLTGLVPSLSVRRLFDAVDLLVPSERSSNRGSPARLLAKAARATPGQTAGEVARQVVTFRPAGLQHVLAPATRPDPGALLLEEAGTAQDRAAYFAEVEAEAAGKVRTTSR